MRMHGGLIYIAICMSVCLSVCDLTKIQTRKKVTRQKVILEGYGLFVCDLTKIQTRKKVTRQKVIQAGVQLNIEMSPTAIFLIWYICPSYIKISPPPLFLIWSIGPNCKIGIFNLKTKCNLKLTDKKSYRYGT